MLLEPIIRNAYINVTGPQKFFPN